MHLVCQLRHIQLFDVSILVVRKFTTYFVTILNLVFSLRAILKTDFVHREIKEAIVVVT